MQTAHIGNESGMQTAHIGNESVVGAARGRTWSAKWRAPFAMLAIATDGIALTELHFRPLDDDELRPQDHVAERTVRELERYVDDPQWRFGVRLAPRGSAFQRRVWDALLAIPPGELRTYGDVARGIESVARAVGQACGANPIALIVPCHRVVASGGALGGFMHHRDGDPLAIKRWLLCHERAGRDLF